MAMLDLAFELSELYIARRSGRNWTLVPYALNTGTRRVVETVENYLLTMSVGGGRPL